MRDLIWACLKGWIRARYPDVATMDAVDLQALLNTTSSSDWLLLDARTWAEFSCSHLPGAVPLHAGANQAEQTIERIAGSRNRPILVVCSVGVRSAKQARKLQRQGFRRVAHLEGGLFEWVNRGHTLEKQGQRTHLVHPFNRLWGLLLRPLQE